MIISKLIESILDEVEFRCRIDEDNRFKVRDVDDHPINTDGKISSPLLLESTTLDCASYNVSDSEEIAFECKEAQDSNTLVPRVVTSKQVHFSNPLISHYFEPCPYSSDDEDTEPIQDEEDCNMHTYDGCILIETEKGLERQDNFYDCTSYISRALTDVHTDQTEVKINSVIRRNPTLDNGGFSSLILKRTLSSKGNWRRKLSKQQTPLLPYIRSLKRCHSLRDDLMTFTIVRHDIAEVFGHKKSMKEHEFILSLPGFNFDERNKHHQDNLKDLDAIPDVLTQSFINIKASSTPDTTSITSSNASRLFGEIQAAELCLIENNMKNHKCICHEHRRDGNSRAENIDCISHSTCTSLDSDFCFISEDQIVPATAVEHNGGRTSHVDNTQMLIEEDDEFYPQRTSELQDLPSSSTALSKLQYKPRLSRWEDQYHKYDTDLIFDLSNAPRTAFLSMTETKENNSKNFPHSFHSQSDENYSRKEEVHDTTKSSIASVSTQSDDALDQIIGEVLKENDWRSDVNTGNFKENLASSMPNQANYLFLNLDRFPFFDVPFSERKLAALLKKVTSYSRSTAQDFPMRSGNNEVPSLFSGSVGDSMVSPSSSDVIHRQSLKRTCVQIALPYVKRSKIILPEYETWKGHDICPQWDFSNDEKLSENQEQNAEDETCLPFDRRSKERPVSDTTCSKPKRFDSGLVLSTPESIRNHPYLLDKYQKESFRPLLSLESCDDAKVPDLSDEGSYTQQKISTADADVEVPTLTKTEVQLERRDEPSYNLIRVDPSTSRRDATTSVKPNDFLVIDNQPESLGTTAFSWKSQDLTSDTVNGNKCPEQHQFTHKQLPKVRVGLSKRRKYKQLHPYFHPNTHKL